jgi:hypothetical protein
MHHTNCDYGMISTKASPSGLFDPPPFNCAYGVISAEADPGYLCPPPNTLLIVSYGADKHQGQPFFLSASFDCCFLPPRPLSHRTDANLPSLLIVAFLPPRLLSHHTNANLLSSLIVVFLR